jgi:hypothetical protein
VRAKRNNLRGHGIRIDRDDGRGKRIRISGDDSRGSRTWISAAIRPNRSGSLLNLVEAHRPAGQELKHDSNPVGDRAVAPPPTANISRLDPEKLRNARLRKAERAERFAHSEVKLHWHTLPNYHARSEQTGNHVECPDSETRTETTEMPIQGNMGPIMRKEDPQKIPLRNPVPQKDEKGAMIFGSRMTRAQLLDYIRTKRLEAEEKRNYQPPPPPMTERMKAQTELEMAAGRRLVEKFAALEAQRRDAANRAGQSGNGVTAPTKDQEPH